MQRSGAHTRCVELHVSASSDRSAADASAGTAGGTFAGCHEQPVPASGHHLTMTVLVPTCGRSRYLEACLRALGGQTRPPDQVVVVVSQWDPPTRDAVDRWRADTNLEVSVGVVQDPGVMAAMQAGLALARCDVIAITDDDAVPHPDWLARLEVHYRDQDVGGAGGRDLIHVPDGRSVSARTARVVGRVSWFGRLTGNHHLGSGEPRSVDVLKGVNLSLRRRLWILDAPLRGTGAQPYWEVDLCLRARRNGCTLIYDPTAVVDHYPGPRVSGDERSTPSAGARMDAAFNYTYTILRWLPFWQRILAAAYLLGVGSRSLPGLIWSILLLGSGRPPQRVAAIARPAVHGTLSAIYHLVTASSGNAFGCP